MVGGLQRERNLALNAGWANAAERRGAKCNAGGSFGVQCMYTKSGRTFVRPTWLAYTN